ncbi:MAG: hypothetical protein MJ237_04705 [bacterium]|nr:hypothetical protein [bacterium]
MQIFPINNFGLVQRKEHRVENQNKVNQNINSCRANPQLKYVNFGARSNLFYLLDNKVKNNEKLAKLYDCLLNSGKSPEFINPMKKQLFYMSQILDKDPIFDLSDEETLKLIYTGPKELMNFHERNKVKEMLNTTKFVAQIQKSNPELYNAVRDHLIKILASIRIGQENFYNNKNFSKQLNTMLKADDCNKYLVDFLAIRKTSNIKVDEVIRRIDFIEYEHPIVFDIIKQRLAGIIFGVNKCHSAFKTDGVIKITDKLLEVEKNNPEYFDNSIYGDYVNRLLCKQAQTYKDITGHAFAIMNRSELHTEEYKPLIFSLIDNAEYFEVDEFNRAIESILCTEPSMSQLSNENKKKCNEVLAKLYEWLFNGANIYGFLDSMKKQMLYMTKILYRDPDLVLSNEKLLQSIYTRSNELKSFERTRANNVLNATKLVAQKQETDPNEYKLLRDNLIQILSVLRLQGTPDHIFYRIDVMQLNAILKADDCNKYFTDFMKSSKIKSDKIDDVMNKIILLDKEHPIVFNAIKENLAGTVFGFHNTQSALKTESVAKIIDKLLEIEKNNPENFDNSVYRHYVSTLLCKQAQTYKDITNHAFAIMDRSEIHADKYKPFIDELINNVQLIELDELNSVIDNIIKNT